GSDPSNNVAVSKELLEKQSGNSRVTLFGSGMSEDPASVRSFKPMAQSRGKSDPRNCNAATAGARVNGTDANSILFMQPIWWVVRSKIGSAPSIRTVTLYVS